MACLTALDWVDDLVRVLVVLLVFVPIILLSKLLVYLLLLLAYLLSAALWCCEFLDLASTAGRRYCLLLPRVEPLWGN